MPRDTGEFEDIQGVAPTRADLASLRPFKVVLSEAGNVGSALREAREALGLAVEDIALVTRVRAGHLAAIEAFDLGGLPSRPFAVGYVRAYARALGLDAEAVVARFKAEAPRVDGELRPPGGLGQDYPRRFGWIAGAAVLLAAAVLTWNFVRHARVAATRPAVPVAAARGPLNVRPPAGPAHLGAPLPAPVEAAMPAAYETPGLAAALDAGASAQSPAATSRKGGQAAVGAADAGVLGAPFVAAGPIYGAKNAGSGVILQARKPTSLVVRGQGGVVYFARQLAAGEAWRAPVVAGLIADVGNPASIEVFAAGASRGTLTDTRTPLARLGA